MFRMFANKLTNASDNLVDWSRVGELLQSQNHRYSKHEIMVRGSIIAFTALSAFLGYALNDKNKSNVSSVTLAIASGLAGFTLSHAVAIYPLWKKRREQQKACELIIDSIFETAKSIPGIDACLLRYLVDEITHISLADEKHDRASQTWGHRRSLLNKLNQGLVNHNESLTNLLIEASTDPIKYVFDLDIRGDIIFLLENNLQEQPVLNIKI